MERIRNAMKPIKKRFAVDYEVIMVTGLGDTQRKEGFYGALRMDEIWSGLRSAPGEGIFSKNCGNLL